MKTLFATMAAVSALAIAAPAAAQSGYGQGYQGNNQQGQYRGGGNADANLSARINQLNMRFQAGVQSGSINRREAMTIRQQLSQLTQLERRYARGGFTGQERSELQRRVNDVRQAIRRADRNNQARWNDYDREDGYGRDGRWNDDDRDDRRYGGDRDDGRYGNDGRYQNDGRYPNGAYEQPQPRSGLGGLVDTLLGGGGLRVGQRVSGNLQVLNGRDRDQYRDDDRSYFRTDGRQIYQIDARTQTVVRVYPMNR